jgi:dTMP kinase
MMGLFITFEGLDGSGKSTQARLLYEDLKKRKIPVLLTREPGGTRIGEQIRATLHCVDNKEMLPATEILLYSASRAQLVGEFILPRLAEGFIVLCDRFVDSTFAYQGYGHGLDMEMLRRVSEFATSGLRPDATVYLDLEVAAGLARRRQAHQIEAGELNRMDRQAVDFYHRVRQGYMEMIAAEPQRWRVINAAQPTTAVHEATRSEVMPIIEKWLESA